MLKAEDLFDQFSKITNQWKNATREEFNVEIQY